VRICNLTDPFAVDELVRDVDVIVHFGGISVERPFEEILEANIRGSYHIYEAARRHGVRRIVFASSNHVTGFYRNDQVIDADAPQRPDGFYGLSKIYGEQLARLYFDRYGIETVCLRIGSCYAEPLDERMLTTWLSYDDLEQLICRAMFVPNVGHTIVYGVSNNRDCWWDNGKASHLGYAPKHSSEPYRKAFESASAARTDDAAIKYQGGSFVKVFSADAH
jgi:uronate dehydrogenase